ncbi:monoamine-oxidase A repressor R1 Zinc-finger domain-containing protein, partial [Helicosporidium sp. ATCC 50920]
MASSAAALSTEVVSFEEVCAGALGSEASRQALAWVADGQPQDPPIRQLVTFIPDRKYQDVRVRHGAEETVPLLSAAGKPILAAWRAPRAPRNPLEVYAEALAAQAQARANRLATEAQTFSPEERAPPEGSRRAHLEVGEVLFAKEKRREREGKPASGTAAKDLRAAASKRRREDDNGSGAVDFGRYDAGWRRTASPTDTGNDRESSESPPPSPSWRPGPAASARLRELRWRWVAGDIRRGERPCWLSPEGLVCASDAEAGAFADASDIWLSRPQPTLEMVSDYERQRQERMAQNAARMAGLGIEDAAQSIRAASARPKLVRKPRSAPAFSEADLVVCRRRSSRVAGGPAPNYKESDLARAGLESQAGTSGRDRRLLKENLNEELYGVEHVLALGRCASPWELFVDGYDKDGRRVYDPECGQTCHQCRQKTLGLRTACSACGSLQGVLCGDCLFMRYGENVREARADPSWTCPVCRDLCNCSAHRNRRGWAPTGSLYRLAAAEGFASAAHMTVLTKLRDNRAREAALPLVPEAYRAQVLRDMEEEAGRERARGQAESAEEEARESGEEETRGSEEEETRGSEETTSVDGASG